MDQKSLKTSWSQRAVIIIIAILLLGSTIATYIAIVVSKGSSSSSSATSAEFDALQNEYTAKNDEINTYAATLSGKYFETLKDYRKEVKSYNSNTANNGGLVVSDLKTGSGREITEEDEKYYAYYIGWCADESVFDSSFDSWDSPASLKAPLAGNAGLIDGWTEGVIGMKLGGVREITIPGELAYADTREICGGMNSPLKFVILAFDDEKMSELDAELEEIYSRLLEAYYAQQ